MSGIGRPEQPLPAAARLRAVFPGTRKHAFIDLERAQRCAWRCVGALIAVLALSSASTTLFAHDSGMGLVRYNPNGTLDASFGQAGVVAERTVRGGLTPEALVIQPDGKIVLAGTSSDLATASVGFGLARYNSDGTLDASFGAGGRVLTRVGAATAAAHAVALLPDGDLVVAGSGFAAATAASNFAVARYTPEGSLDPGFGAQGKGSIFTPVAAGGAEARAIAIQPDGRIVVAGTAFASGETNDALGVARYNPDGSLDPGFGTGGIVSTSFDTSGSEGDTGSNPVRTAALLIQPDGKLVAVGSVGGHQGAFALVRYLPNGDLDSAFGLAGKVLTRRTASAQAYAAALQVDGDIVVAGGLGSATDSVAFALARYRPDGDLDAGFGSGGFVVTGFGGGGGGGVHAVAVESDGRIVAVGSAYAAAPAPPPDAGTPAVNGGFGTVRYLPDGTADTKFGKGGVAITTVGDAGSMPAGLAVQSDGRLVAAGLTYFLVPTPAVDRLNVNPLLVVPAVGLLMLVMAILVRRRLRMTGSRTGQAPEA